MTSKIVVNNIEADAGVSTVFFNSDIGATDGTLNVDGNLTVDGVITYEDVTNVDSVGIVTARSGLHVTSGLVGLGTDNPTKKLQVFDSSATSTTARANTVARFLSNASNADCNIQLSNGVDHSAQIGIVGNGAEVYIAQDGIERLRINSSGNIGIGTDNPARKVEIFDTAATVLQLNSTNSGGTSLRIQNSGTDKMYMGLAGDFIVGQGSNVTDSAVRASGALLFASGGGTERLRIDSSGRLLQGLTSAKTGFFNDNNAAPVHQIQGSTYYTTAFSIFRNGAGQSGPNFILAKGREGIVQDNDILGSISFQGHDGTTELIEGASIQSRVNGTPGSNDMPGCLTFNTSSDNSSLPTERLRIDSSGRLLIATSASQGKWNNSSGDDHIVQIESTSAFSQSWISHSTSSTAGVQLDIGRSRGSSDGDTNLVSNGDLLGHLCFQGADGSQFVRGARISSVVQGTAAADNMPAALVFETNSGGNNSTERLRIASSGQVNVNQANNNNLLGQLTVFEGTDFNISSQGGRDNIYLISDKSSGYNSYGSSIAWSRVQYADRRAAAIANVQTSTDEDHVGLAFFTHPSADATANIEEKFRITHDGIHVTNGVSNFYVAFQLANNQSYNWDIAVPNEGGYGNSFRCECGYNHYYTTSYGAHRSAWISARGTSTNNMFDQDQSHSQAGAWSFSKPNNTTFRVTKSAGTYGGSGYGFIHVRFNYF